MTVRFSSLFKRELLEAEIRYEAISPKLGDDLHARERSGSDHYHPERWRSLWPTRIPMPEVRLPTLPCLTKLSHMKAKFTYWKESDGKYLGYLHSHPDHWTQGEDFEDLKAHLRDLHEMFSSEEIPGIRQVAELEVA